MVLEMFTIRRVIVPIIGGLILYGAGCSTNDPAHPSVVEPGANSVKSAREHSGPLANGFTVFATGLNNPRGLRFGPDGDLYVAEGGIGGADSTVGQCDQVPAPIGPYKGSTNGSRISKISPDGVVSTVVDGLPSSQTSPLSGGLVSGVADVAFIGGTLYALISGAGCSHGVASIPNEVIRVNGDGSWTQIADLSAYFQSHPVANPEPDDFEPDGTPYHMIAVRGMLVFVEPNHGELDQVDPMTGNIRRILDISASQGHIVPTSVAYRGRYYVGNLGTFPVAPGTEKILSINNGGHFQVPFQGLTTVLGLAFDAEGRLYVLETSAAPGGPTPGMGMVVRLSRNGNVETVVDGLTFPTGITFGPGGDNRLYISNQGFGFPPGQGQIVTVDIPNDGGDGDNRDNGDNGGNGDNGDE